jgi:hypothetical protein
VGALPPAANLRSSVKLLVLGAAVSSIAVFVLMLLISGQFGESGELSADERRQRVERQLEERFLIETQSCEKSPLQHFYRCKLKTSFRYVPGKLEDEWCVDPSGTPMFPIRNPAEANRCV